MPAGTKTAQETENDTRGSQNMTMQDRGDYGTQAEQVSLQDKETKGHAPDGTPEMGSQNMTQKNDDKSYSHDGSGGSAKLGALAAIAATVKGHPQAGNILAAALKLAQEVPGGQGPQGTSGDTSDLDEMGGEPEAVAEGEEAAGAEAAPAASPEAVSMEPSEHSVEVKLEDTIRDKQDEVEIEKQVLDELKDVYQEVTGKKVNDATAKRIAAAMLKVSQDPNSAKTNEPDENVLASARYNNDVSLDKNPDKALAEQARQATAEPRHKGNAAGQEFASFADRDYGHKTAARKSVFEAIDQMVKKEGISVEQATRVMAATRLGQMVFASMASARKPDEAGAKERTAMLEDKKRYIARQKQAKARIEKLMKEGKSKDEAIKMVANSPLGKWLQKKTAELQKAAQESEEHVGPTGDSKDKGEGTTNYTGEDAGDKSNDEIADGTNTTLESPETDSAAAAARSTVDSDHAGEMAGSTTAMFSAKQRKNIVAELKQFDATFDGIQKAAKKINGSLTPQVNRTVVATLMEAAKDLKATGDKIEVLLKGADKKVSKEMAHRQVVALIREGRVHVKAAKRQVTLLSGMMTEATVQKRRFDRVSPSFALAVKMVQAGQIPMEVLPKKVAEFINMNPSEFKVASKTISELLQSNGRRSRKPGHQRVASRLPFVSTEGSVDELDGLFDDDSY